MEPPGQNTLYYTTKECVRRNLPPHHMYVHASVYFPGPSLCAPIRKGEGGLVGQHRHIPTLPSLLPSTRYPSLTRTRSTMAGVRPSSAAATPAPQSHCRPSTLSYTLTTSSPAAQTIRRASNAMLIMAWSYAYASWIAPVRRSQI
jgi:hypothetical protein